MQVTVLYFAAARERAGLQRESLELPEGCAVSAALRAIAARHPSIEPLLPHLRVAIDQQFADPADPIPGGAELALIPPVAGGSARFDVVDRPLSLAEVTSAVEDQGLGGVVTFTGVVRNESGGRRVGWLGNEGDGPMAPEGVGNIRAPVSPRLARTPPGGVSPIWRAFSAP